MTSNLNEVKDQRDQLKEMNEDLSAQVAEGLETIKSLQEREQELGKRLDFVKGELDAAQNGMAVELENHWQAEDEILNLQSDLEKTQVLLQESNAKNQILDDQLQKAKTNEASVLNQLKNMNLAHENELKAKEKVLDELSANLAAANEDLKTKSETESNLDEAKRDNAILAKGLNETKDRMVKLEESLKDKTAKIDDQAKEIIKLRDDLDGADAVAMKFREMEGLLQDYMNDVSDLERQLTSCKSRAQEQDEEIRKLQEELNPIQDESSSYKERFEALEAMIEPFKEQLESFEAERNALLTRNIEAEGEVKKLASQYGQLLGHQNHKQKIQHLVKIKQENVDMRQEISKLRLELDKYKRAAIRSGAGRFNKENRTPSTTMMSRDVSGLVAKPDLSFLSHSNMHFSTPNPRRQTVASPLTTRNHYQ